MAGMVVLIAMALLALASLFGLTADSRDPGITLHRAERPDDWIYRADNTAGRR